MTNHQNKIYSPDFERYRKRTTFNGDYPEWLNHIRQKAQSLARHSRKFYVQGLTVDCRSESVGHLEWLAKYLQPLAQTETEQHAETIDHFTIASFFSDELITDIAHFIHSGLMDSHKVYSSKGLNERLIFSPHLVVDYEIEQGMVYLTDLKSRSITLVTSSHTRLSVHQLSRCVRDVITGFLRNQGWHTFHAGAIETPDGIFMIVGDKGAGKTSLILAMLHGGATFVANDRVFIKQVGDKVFLLSAPMSVAIGLGTAMQYPQLKKYISHPNLLAYPSLVFDTKRVTSTPEIQWSELPDKIQMFASELERDFKCKSVSGGEIKGVLFPTLSDRTYLSLNSKEPQQAKEILQNNRFPWQTDGVVPPWRPLDYGNPAEETVPLLINKLLNLPLVDFHYHASSHRLNEVREYPNVLSQYLTRE